MRQQVCTAKMQGRIQDLVRRGGWGVLVAADETPFVTDTYVWLDTTSQIFRNARAVPIIGSAKISATDIGSLAHIGNR